MAKMNLLIDLRAYEGNNANTSRSVFNKNFQQTAINIEREIVQELEIPANTVRLLFSVSDAGDLPPLDTGLIATKQTIIISADQDLDYITLNHRISPDTLLIANGRLLAHVDVDFTVELLATTTKITWIGSFARGGDEALQLGESIFAFYSYSSGTSTPVTPVPVDNTNLYKFFYIETDKECDIIINGTVRHKIKPVVVNKVAKKGYFLSSTDIDNVYVSNANSSSIIVYFITSK